MAKNIRKGLNATEANPLSLLDPSMTKKGPYNSKWNVRVNLSEEELLSWKET